VTNPLKPPSENLLHCQLADLLRVAAVPGWLWWHTPNGELRNKATAGRLKRMGVKPGVSDFLLLSPVGDLHALELKAKGKRPTDAQRDFLRSVIDAGGRGAWCDRFEDAVMFLKNWGAIKGVLL
jgi:hypothetical protein